MKKNIKIGIIGGGIGGLTLALTLEHFGFSDYQVYEQAPEFKEVGAAISVWPNALRVLKRVGVYDELSLHWGEIREALIRTQSGKVLSRITPSYELPSVCMHRADLHRILRENIPDTKLFSNHQLKEIEQKGDKGILHFKNGTRKEVDVAIGADGIHSIVRQQIIGDGKPVFRGYNIWRGIAEVNISQGYGSESWGKGARVGIVPINAKAFGWWATLNETQETTDEPEGTRAKLNRLFGNWHPPIPELIEKSPTIIINALVDRAPKKGWSKGNAVLLGDAAHPTTPNLGQGACMAIEGAYLLSACLHQFSTLQEAFNRYEELHFPRSSSVTKESLMNGRMGQLENSWLIGIRNSLIAATPSKTAARMLDKYFSYNVTKVKI